MTNKNYTSAGGLSPFHGPIIYHCFLFKCSGGIVEKQNHINKNKYSPVAQNCEICLFAVISLKVQLKGTWVAKI